MKASEFFKAYGFDEARKQIKKPTGIYGAAFDYQFMDDLKHLVESHELVEKQGGLERVKKAIDGKHIGYTHFYLHSNGRYVFLDHYVDFIPDHAQHIGMFNKVIADVESCQ